MIYLDYQATTPLAPEVVNWAIKGTFERSSRRKLVTITTEHAAVLDSAEWLEGQGVEIIRLPVSPDGLIDLATAEIAIDDQTALVAAMLVNNEIGVIQPIAELARLAHAHGALMLCDAVQGFGRMPIPDGPDLIAISAHKIHGPKGIGALWMRAGAEPAPLLHGGGQERGLRSGTLSPALCVGFGAAAAIASERSAEDSRHLEQLWTAARAALGPEWDRRRAPAVRVPRYRLFARFGLCQWFGPAEPCAPRTRPRRPRRARGDPTRLWPLYERSRACRCMPSLE